MTRWLPAALLLLLVADEAEARNRFWVVNETGVVIESLTIFVPGSTATADVLTAPLASGRRTWVVPPMADCRLDLIAYLPDRIIRREIDACRLSRIVLHVSDVVPGGTRGQQAAPVPPMPVPMPPEPDRVTRPPPGIEPPSPWGFSPGTGLPR